VAGRFFNLICQDCWKEYQKSSK